ncbi:glutathionylspermidine synthase family protein [Myroides sp. LJL119]
MEIKKLTPQDNWQTELEELGFGYHTDNGIPYWIENYYYSITEDFANEIFRATDQLWTMSLDAVQYVIDNNLFHQFQIPLFIVDHIKYSWENETPSIYGRFDLAFDKNTQKLKLLEFNADTPTSLFETGVVQWHWKEKYFKDKVDQFNSVHELLIQHWREIKAYLKSDTLHFSCMRETLEDLTTVEYLRDCAIQAGIKTKLIYVDDIGWDSDNFVDLENQVITDIFKLYPWEWLAYEPFALHIPNDLARANWIEPSWKMILSNKALLPILWKLYPDHPLLLEAYFDTPMQMKDYVKKPLLSREGANITLYKDSKIVEATKGDYGQEGYVCQKLATPLKQETGYPIIGSWVIGNEPCGLTFRESDSLITTDKSRFIPHIIE